MSGTLLDSTSGSPSHPSVWLLTGEKRGDNAQVVNLARAIGWPYQIRTVIMKSRWREGKPRVRPSLRHIDVQRSDPLEPPWPDLVITAGRRLSSVGLWIKRASKGRTRLVMIGRPRRLLESVDLAVVAAHYALPEGERVARHDLPLMHADPVRLEQAATQWAARLGSRPRPLTALMVGGPTGGLRFDLATARELLAKARECVARSGGSLYMTTSRRTPSEIVRMLERECTESERLYVFDPDSPPDENPYYGLLALADRFVVTTDSISMMVEVARLGRSLSLFPLESEITLLERILEKLGLWRHPSPREDPIPAGGIWARLMNRLGWPRHSRDLSAIPRLLVSRGLAGWLGDPPVPAGVAFSDVAAVETVAARIRSMWMSEDARSLEGA